MAAVAQGNPGRSADPAPSLNVPAAGIVAAAGIAPAAVTVIARRPGSGAAELLTAALDQLDLAGLLAGEPGVAILAAAPTDPTDTSSATGVDELLLARLRQALEAAGAGPVEVVTSALLPEQAPAVERGPAELGEGAALQGVALPSAWLKADVRVVVSGATTDPLQGYRGCCVELAGLLPADCAVDAAQAVTDLLQHLPPHLAIIDATLSSDGCFGSLRAAPRATGTVLAGTSALAVDEVLAGLMGVDPAASPVVAHALTELAVPVPRLVHGPLHPWQGWRPAPPELSAACRRAAAILPTFGRLLQSFAADVPTPDDDPVLREGRRWFAALAANVDDDPLALAGLVGFAESVAFWGQGALAWSTVFDKSRVPRRKVSLGLDLGSFTMADYDAVADYLAPLMALAAAAAPRASGLRWRRHGGGVLFSVERDLDAPYDQFVARVDLGRAIRLMNDYVGGTAVVVARDEQGRVLRQAERNLYLPQPNYLAYSGGDCIDVCKLEILRYSGRESTISWRTVRSPNGTAVHDDGAVTFRAVGDNRTRVSIFGLQEFVLPPFWQAMDLARYPGLYDALTEDAYRRFFSATLDNFEACYEGREVPTGHAVLRDPEPPTARWSRALRLAAGLLADSGPPASIDPEPEVDEDGFRRVAGRPTPRVELTRPSPSRTRWASVAEELREAVARDLARDPLP